MHRYDSFEEKIKDYVIRKLEWHHKTKNESGPDRFRGEYNTLTKARNDIKKKIDKVLDAALFYPKIVQWACLPNIKEHNTYPQFKDLAADSKLRNFPAKLNKDGEIRRDIEEENKNFVMEIFSEERLSRIIETIFYNNYTEIDESDEEYRIRIAEMLMTKSVYELKRRMDPNFSRLIGKELDKAAEIAYNVRYQRMKK